MPLYLGVMSGTSLDGVDIALVDLQHLPTWQIALVAYREFPFPKPLAQAAEALFVAGQNEIERVSTLSVELGQLYADCINMFLADCDVSQQAIAAIGLHGQTVRHSPDSSPAFTWQIGNPDIVACRTGIPVICDFRNTDMALGGQGAPLVPPFHQALLAQSQQQDAQQFVLNLGGIANVTYLSGQHIVSGYDIGPANALLDIWYRAHHAHCLIQYDRDGVWAATGQVNAQLLKIMLDDPYFSRPAPKSTGKEHFDFAWITRTIAAYQADVSEPIAPHDVQRTLLELTVMTIKQALWFALDSHPDAARSPPTSLWLCGGGARNLLLQTRLVEVFTPCHVHVHILPNSDAIEAMAFAWLAYCYDAKLNNNSPIVTGASRPAICGKKVLIG